MTYKVGVLYLEFSECNNYFNPYTGSKKVKNWNLPNVKHKNKTNEQIYI